MVALDGGEGGRVDGKAQARGETHGAQQAQMVLAKAYRGIADGAEHAERQIGASADVIHDDAGIGVHRRPLMVKSRRSTSWRGSVSKCTLSGRRPSV